jgi:NADH:ubiquinone oxidoreductase subunit F (NADH-binding)/ferredoxin
MLCRGHGACVKIAPDVFDLDRFGLAFVRPEVRDRAGVEPELRAQARLAASRCPVAAVLISEAKVPADSTPVALPRRATPPVALALPAPGEHEHLADWRARGGFRAVDAARIRRAVETTHLAGSGGAAYPVAAKWAAVSRGRAVTLVANGAEREPGTAKDRYLLTHRPFAVLDGIRVARDVLGASRCVLAVDGDGDEALDAIERARAALASEGLLDADAIEVRRAPARYVAGEETALLAALDGRPALPARRPPYPTSHGLAGAPTVVHNVETLVRIAELAARVDRTGIATPAEVGLFSVGRLGDEPVVVERPLGIPLRTLLAEQGFRDVAAVLVGGWSGTLLPPHMLDVPLSSDGLRTVGARLGTKSVAVVDAGECVAAAVARVVTFLGQESAGQCPPCVQGVPYLAATLDDLARGRSSRAAVVAADRFADTLVGRGACALPDGAAQVLRSFVRNFEDEIDAHLAGRCTRTTAVGGTP